MVPPADDELELWARWREQGDPSARASLLDRHLPYAKIVAATYFGRRINDEIEFGDYLQFARLGMIEAFDRYEPNRGAQFRTFAARRMHGAILDGLVQMTERQEQIAARRRVLDERLDSIAGPHSRITVQATGGSLPTASDPAAALRHLAQVGMGLVLGFLLDGTSMLDNEQAKSAGDDLPYASVELKQQRRMLQSMLKQLPSQEHYVLKCHYQQGMLFDDIATAMGLSKGRISQIHKKALESLRTLVNARNRCDMSI